MEFPPPTPLAPPTPPATQLSAVGWLAATGATMVLLAAIVAVSGRWETITPELRFSGLVACVLAVYFAAETFRSRLPSTSLALATLAATLAAPVAIAAAATLERRWPDCVLVGGLVALAATEVQSRRWATPVLKWATVAAAGLAATGLAALTGGPVAVIGAAAAVMFMIVGAEKRSIGMSIAVALSPGIVLLANQGVGTGTISRIGASGSVLSWAAPTSAAIAAMVIAVAASRHRNVALVGLSATTLVSGVLVGMLHADLGPTLWWSVPACAVIAVEVVGVARRTTVWNEAVNRARPFVVVPAACGGALVPVLVGGGRVIAGVSGRQLDLSWTVPAAITACSLWIAATSSARRGEAPRNFTLLFAAAASATLGTAMTLGTARGWPEVASLTATSALMALVGRSRGALWVHRAAAMSVVAAALTLAVAGANVAQATQILMAVGAALTVAAFTRSEFGPTDTAAVTSSLILVLVSLNASPALASVALALASGQLTMYAFARANRELAVVTISVFVGATVSTWWTSGANQAAISAIAPYGADGIDVAIAAVSLSLIVAGALVRRMASVSTWMAYSPGLGMAAAWLLDAQFDERSIWATVLALGLGVVATGIGGVRHLGAPLVIGTGLIAGSVLISAGPRLTVAPTWLWIALGGAGLVGLAGLIERKERRTGDSPRRRGGFTR